ncbi:uncharacterized protein ACMZJ9_010051 [Mantella aurantiaca]
MGRISPLTLLLFISGILLSNHCINGQETTTANETPVPEAIALALDLTTEAGVVLTNVDNCHSHVQAGLDLCPHLVGVDDLNALLASPDFEVCSVSFQHYACANLVSVTASTVFNILNCVLTNPDSIITQGAFSLFINKLSLETIGSTLTNINKEITASSITAQSRSFLLNAVFEKLWQDPDNLTPGFLESWTQDKLYFFITAINIDILNCLTTTPMTCDGMEAVVNGLNFQYDSFNNESKADIGMWITRFIKSHSCQKNTLGQSITLYQNFKNGMNFEDFEMAFGNVDWSSALSYFNENQVQQFVVSTGAFNSYASASGVLSLLEDNDFAYNYGFLNNLPASNYDFDIKYSLLNNLLNKLNSADDPLCKPQIKTIFQGKLSYLLVAINETILQKFALKDCSEFQDTYQAIDDIYDQLTPEVQNSVNQHRLTFLNGEASKSGSACTYGLNSADWLVKNLGKSSGYVTYSELLTLNSNFDGYQAAAYLNTNQTIDLLLYTEIFTSASPSDIETRVTAVTNALQNKGYVSTKLFLTELKTNLMKKNVKIIVNIQVRFLFLEGLWGTMKTQFQQFKSNDWYSLTDSMSYFLSTISTQQLSDLSSSVVESCSNMMEIVEGLGENYNEMNGNTKSDVTDWISSFLRSDTTHCISVQGDWLVECYKVFKQDVSISTIEELNPDYNLRGSIEILNSNQLGALIMQDSEAHSDVAFVESVIAVLTNYTHEENMDNLGKFWDSFVSEYEKSANFSNEVKHTMLYHTVSELSVSLTTFTSEETTLWFEQRMYPVMDAIDTEVLSEIPVDVGCGFQTSFVKSLSFVSNDLQETNRNDVVDYLLKFLTNDQQNRAEDKQCTKQESSTVTYITNYCGDYSVDMSYATVKSLFTNFNVFETGVFEMLNSDQFGDMIVEEKVYDSEEKVTQVFNYLQTQTIETVDSVMARFAESCTKYNVQITNVGVGQKILENYFNIIKTKVTTYTTVQIKQMFEIRIYILIQFFTTQTLSIFVVQDCDMLVIIVTELNKGINKMSASTKTDIVNWIISNLKSPSLNGCTSTYTTTSEWIEYTMKGFFEYTTLKVVLEIVPQLDVLSIISQTSVSQKVEYLCSSTVLTDASVTMTVLESISGQDNVTSAQEVVTFLTDFNSAYEQLNIKTMTTEVREEAMTYLFSSYMVDFNSLTEEYISNFGEMFTYFIGGMTSESVGKIPDMLNCNSYNSIFDGISSGYDGFQDDVKKAVYKKTINCLDHQRSISPDVCSQLYTDSRSYIQVMFHKSSSEASIYDFEQYYKEFDSYSCLDVLTSTQLGNLLMNSSATTDVLQAAQILVEVKKRDYEEIQLFLDEVDMVAQEKNITKLPDSNVQDLIFKTVWPVLTENVENIDYKEIFSGKLKLVLSSCSASDIAALPVNIDCSSQIEMVKSFSDIYDEMDDDKKQAMYHRIRIFNHDIQITQGSACSSGSDSEWIQNCYGMFVNEASASDFKEDNKNFSAASALNVCTGPQVADYAIESGALKSEEDIIPVLESIDTSGKMKGFLDRCNSEASEDLQNSPVGKEILDKTFQILTPEINNFQPSDWKMWTQDTLKNIIHNINDTELEKIRYPMNCESYKQLVIGLNNGFDIMSEESRHSVYRKCIKPQFDSVVSTTGVKCGQKNGNVEVWIQDNFAKFSELISIDEYISWNTEYKATDLISTLNADQLADVAAAAVTNEDVACQVAAKVQEFDISDVNSFLDKLSATLKEKNINSVSNVVSFKFLSSSLSVISNSLSSYSTSQWQDLMSNKLQPFISAIDSDQLTSLLNFADCSAYKSILQQLNDNYDNFSPATSESLFEVLFGYVKKRNTGSDSCATDGGDSSASITNSLGRFSNYLSYPQFLETDLTFSWTSAAKILSSKQLAEVSLNENVFTDQDQANVLNGRLAEFSFTDIDAYLRAFQATAQSKNIMAIAGGANQQAIFSTIFSKVSARFVSFTYSEWNDYFGSLFSWFYQSFQASQVELIPETISCENFQAVVSGCSNNYAKLQDDVKTALFAKIKSVLSNSQSSNGVSCPSSSSSSDWLLNNFGELRVKASMSDIFAFNPNFRVTEALTVLTSSQLGSYIANNNILSDQVIVTQVMSSLTVQSIGLFLDSFNNAAEANGITEISNVAVRKLFIGEIFCKAGSGFASFSTSDYSDFFNHKLKLVLSSLDSKTLGFIPDDISCDSLAAIMKPLIDLPSSPENPTAIFNFVYSALSRKQINTETPCMNDNLDVRQWLLTFFGQYTKIGSWADMTKLCQDMNVAENFDIFSSIQLADAAAETTVIQNVTVITVVMNSVIVDLDSLYSFLSTLWRYVAVDPTLLSNTKVKEVILNAVAMSVLTKFDVFTVPQVDDWMNKISFLLSSFNGTILEHIPMDTGCAQYQSFIYHMDPVFSSLTQVKKKDVADFILNYLGYQAHTNADPCTVGIANTNQWIQKNIASYCSLLTVEDILAVYPDVDKVSYERICNLAPLS